MPNFYKNKLFWGNKGIPYPYTINLPGLRSRFLQPNFAYKKKESDYA